MDLAADGTGRDELAISLVYLSDPCDAHADAALVADGPNVVEGLFIGCQFPVQACQPCRDLGKPFRLRAVVKVSHWLRILRGWNTCLTLRAGLSALASGVFSL